MKTLLLIIIVSLLTTGISASESNFKTKSFGNAINHCGGFTGQELIEECVMEVVKQEMSFQLKNTVANMISECKRLYFKDEKKKIVCMKAANVNYKIQIEKRFNLAIPGNEIIGPVINPDLLCFQGDDLQKIGAVSETTRDALKAVTIREQTRKLSSTRQK